VDRLLVLLPAIAVISLGLVLLAIYTAKLAAGRPPVVDNLKTNEVFGLFWSRYAYWALRPVERGMIAAGFSPNFVTFLSFLACVGTGVSVAFGQLATGCWLFFLSGALDMLDGRLARALGRQTQAGALFDSVADRWAELAAFAGYAWYLRETPWLLAALGCSAASMMVSYTRARCEGLGLTLRAGAMQRAERMTLVSAGTLVAATFHAGASTVDWVVPTVGGVLTLCGVLSMLTALRRWRDGYRALLDRSPAL
jgi:phosphatidylglycerophosphate synthase